MNTFQGVLGKLTIDGGDHPKLLSLKHTGACGEDHVGIRKELMLAGSAGEVSHREW